MLYSRGSITCKALTNSVSGSNVIYHILLGRNYALYVVLWFFKVPLFLFIQSSSWACSLKRKNGRRFLNASSLTYFCPLRIPFPVEQRRSHGKTMGLFKWKSCLQVTAWEGRDKGIQLSVHFSPQQLASACGFPLPQLWFGAIRIGNV